MKPMKHFFTLIEILTVAAIIAILAGISVGVIGLISNKNAEAQTQATIKALELAMGQYKAEFGHPFFQYNQVNTIVRLDIPSPFAKTDSHGLKKYFKQDADHPERQTYKTSLLKFLDMKMVNMSVKEESDDIAYFVDGWGRPLIFRIPGKFNKTGFDLGSVGPDGKVGDGQGTEVTATSLPTASNYETYFGQGDDITNFLAK